MKRLAVFVIVLACAVGLLIGTAGALTAQADDLAFTEIVRWGDPAALEGRQIGAVIRCGDHMMWKTSYSFAGDNAYDTEFLFSQEGLQERISEKGSSMEAYSTSGFGGSTSGDMSLRNTGYGDLFRAVAVVTPAGDQRELNLKLSDYVKYHALSLDISYLSSRYYCSEYVDIFDHVSTRWGEDTADFDVWATVNNPSFLRFSELFRFPVGEEEIVTVTARRDELDNLISLGLNTENSPEIRIICTVNDSGAYCIPSYCTADGKPIPGEYRDGMGIYHIPWKPDIRSIEITTPDGRVEAVMLDCVNAENVHPLPEDAMVFGLEVEENTGMARMISLEDGNYVLTQIDLEQGVVCSRLEIMKRKEMSADYWPSWQIGEGLMILEACGELALITLDEVPVLEFVVPLADAEPGFREVIEGGGAMHYDGARLILANSGREYEAPALVVQVFDRTGVLYWGEYGCSIFSCNDPGFVPYIRNDGTCVTIE